MEPNSSSKERTLEKLDTKVAEGRSALWVVVVITSLYGVYHYLAFRTIDENALKVLISSLGIALLFVVMTQLSRFKPFISLLASLILFLLLVAGVVAMDVMPWLVLFMAILITGGIVRGIVGAKQAEQIRNQI